MKSSSNPRAEIQAQADGVAMILRLLVTELGVNRLSHMSQFAGIVSVFAYCPSESIIASPFSSQVSPLDDKFSGHPGMREPSALSTDHAPETSISHSP